MVLLKGGLVPKYTTAEVEAHKHRWIESDHFDLRCSCGGVRVSPLELDRRDREWRAYDEAVRLTPAYKDYVLMGKAFKERNMKLIKEIEQRVEDRQKTNGYELQSPPFPDPATFPYQVEGQV